MRCRKEAVSSSICRNCDREPTNYEDGSPLCGQFQTPVIIIRVLDIEHFNRRHTGERFRFVSTSTTRYVNHSGMETGPEYVKRDWTIFGLSGQPAFPCSQTFSACSRLCMFVPHQ
ncbi:Hypothetical predicted protein [Scomber scombrus]|uniref:Uncharacterized protein n=1 Tax=Scomber scombrus TaxID=13677 RepID=A0AAV1PDJ6_SCOSC